MDLPRLPTPALSDAQAADLRRGFAALMTALDHHPTLDVRPLRQFMAPLAPDKARVAVRCDISGDPAWTLPLARLAARHAVATTFFAGHREEYFGQDGWLTAFLAAGPELGLKVVPWVAGDPDPAQAAPAVAAAIGWLRDRRVDVHGVAFDPPCHGVPAEACEIFLGGGLGGRTRAVMADGTVIPLQVLDPAALSIGYTTQFGPPRAGDAAGLDSYFALAQGSTYRSAALRHAAWSNHPLFDWQGIITLAYGGDGRWVRHDGNTTAPAVTDWDVAALVAWIAEGGARHRYQFIFDPRLLAP